MGCIGYILVLVAADLVIYNRRRLQADVLWKTNAKLNRSTEVGDPLMRLVATLKVKIVSAGLQLTGRIPTIDSVLEQPTTQFVTEAKSSQRPGDAALSSPAQPATATTVKGVELAISPPVRKVAWAAPPESATKMVVPSESKCNQSNEGSGLSVGTACGVNTSNFSSAGSLAIVALTSRARWREETSDGRARIAAQDMLSRRGFNDRKIGTFAGIPEADIAEPARTERLLAKPFTFRHAVLADAVQVCLLMPARMRFSCLLFPPHPLSETALAPCVFRHMKASSCFE